MKFTCNQQILAKALNTVSKAVSNRTTIPILKGIMIKATEEGSLILTASDLEISIKKEIAADVQEPGAIVVMAKLFGDIINGGFSLLLFFSVLFIFELFKFLSSSISIMLFILFILLLL